MNKSAPLFEPTIAAIVTPVVLATLMTAVVEPRLNVDSLFLMVFATSIVSFVHTIFLGLPAVLFLKKMDKMRWWSLVCVGCIVGCGPTGFLLWPLGAEGGFSHWDGAKVVVLRENGIPTSAGWAEYTNTVLLMGAIGAISGLTFWLVQRIILHRNLTSKLRVK
ncbi:MAG: hypothetical protein K2Y28_17805 [Burkholderiaceae bacterium]|nr:hypothetical protein [Burkholderiaceae bacterium]